MKFGRVSVDEAVGSILAHATRHRDGVIKKGRVLTEADVAVLRAAGVTRVMVARLADDDVPEDEAARKLAVAIAGQGTVAQEAFTGRANIHAQRHGLVVIDVKRVNEINHLHESLTIATLPPHAVVVPRQMLATVKIIPFATPRMVLDKALAIVNEKPLFHVRLFQKRAVHLIITTLPQTRQTIIAKSESSIRTRLQALGLGLAQVTVVAHEQHVLSDAVRQAQAEQADLILIFGASAIVDRGDVIPASLVQAGGVVEHLGMPVDPGNLLMLGRLDDVPVIGIPSCARSPKRNGFDWVLERVCAGLTVLPEDIMDMGVGGLLAEIASRPEPREPKVALAPRISAVVLAAGASTRMGAHKMVAEFRGKPMVRVTVEHCIASHVDDVVVVTGHGSEDVTEALAGLPVRLIHNPEFAAGLSSSVRVGVSAVKEADAALICLGDMPLVAPAMIDRLIAAFNPVEHRNIIVPCFKGQLGNPVLWGRAYFDQLLALEGDRGARNLIAKYRHERVEIEVENDSVLRDVDTLHALAELQQR